MNDVWHPVLVFSRHRKSQSKNNKRKWMLYCCKFVQLQPNLLAADPYPRMWAFYSRFLPGLGNRIFVADYSWAAGFTMEAAKTAPEKFPDEKTRPLERDASSGAQ